MSDWQNCKNILCIRPDNMGDLILSAPAIRAIKETFHAKITVLTSSMAAGIVQMIPEIDETIVFDLPWVKTDKTADRCQINAVVEIIKARGFDGAIIFTVFSQNPLPTAMLPYLAGIPKILAYCRENPYQLLTDWVPDKEPYQLIKHQVRRDLNLVATIGANTGNNDLHLTVNEKLWPTIESKLTQTGLNLNQPWLIFHAGVSEKKREYPVELWAAAAKKLITEKGMQVVFSGSSSEKSLTDDLAKQTGDGAFSAGGMFKLDEFICLIKHAPLIVSVNTSTIHIAAAVKTPLVVLYAETNPQHTPWNVPCKVLYFPVPVELASKNEVIRYLNDTCYCIPAAMPGANEIIAAVDELLNQPYLPVQSFRGILNENQVSSASQ